MRNWIKLMLGFAFGFVGFLLLPFPAFKFFAFIVPCIIFCMVFKKEDDFINMTMFILLLVAFAIVIPSNLLTFDASNGINFTMISSGLYAMVGVFASVIFIGMPIFFAVGAIWAFIIGQVDKSGTNIMRLLLALAFAFVLLSVLRIIGLRIPFLEGLTDFYVNLINIVFRFPLILYNILNTGINMLNSMAYWVEELVNNADWLDLADDMVLPRLPKLPSIPSYQMPKINIGFDATYQTFSAGGGSQVVYYFHDSLPIIMAIVCLISSFFTMPKQWENIILNYIEKMELEEEEVEKEPKINFQYLDYTMLSYLLILMFFGLVIFLGFTYSYGVDPREDAKYTIIFMYYMIMTVVSVLVLNLQGGLYYKKARPKETLYGIAFGLTILILITRMFTAQDVVYAYSASGLSSDAVYIANTFVFVAPAESLFFHVLLPAIVAGAIMQYTKRNMEAVEQIPLKDEYIEANLEKRLQKKRVEKARLTEDKDLIKLELDILEEIEKDITELEGVEIEVDIDESSLFGRLNSNTVFVIFAVVIGNLAFSVIHWIIPFVESNYKYDIFTYFTSGLGTIYFAGGCLFTFISIKYGWFSAVMTHALFNTLTIIMVIMTMGV